MSFALSFGAYAEEKQDALKYDEQQVNAEFKQLDKLENYVNTHEGVTLDEVNANTKLTSGVTLDKSSSVAMVDDLPGNIPAFWWGCVLSWVGVLIVYLIAKDSAQTKKAWMGCLVGTGISVVLWLVLGIAGSGI